MNSTSKHSGECTHPVPPNEHGVFAMHSTGNEPLPLDGLEKVLNGPHAAMQDDLSHELAKTGETDESGGTGASFGEKADVYLAEYYAKFGSTTPAQKIHVLEIEIGGHTNFPHEMTDQQKLPYLEQEFLDLKGLMRLTLA